MDWDLDSVWDDVSFLLFVTACARRLVPDLIHRVIAENADVNDEINSLMLKPKLTRRMRMLMMMKMN